MKMKKIDFESYMKTIIGSPFRYYLLFSKYINNKLLASYKFFIKKDTLNRASFDFICYYNSS